VIQERGSQGSSLLPADPDDSLTVLKKRGISYRPVLWIREWIRIDFGGLDPYPGRQKCLRIEKSEEISSFKMLDVLY
jgi:hypothetical protein